MNPPLPPPEWILVIQQFNNSVAVLGMALTFAVVLALVSLVLMCWFIRLYGKKVVETSKLKKRVQELEHIALPIEFRNQELSTEATAGIFGD